MNQDEFFGQIVKSSYNPDRQYEDIIFLLASEFGYTQQEIEDTDIPFIFMLLNARVRSYKEQERQMKQKR